ncbi:hypothetical protein [Spirulina sp. 06S082]|uniref:hypothetical protein n=1 Tax=Spirulina sp. 06S082 TaxID=3110248 RepID=UPI002B21DC65|nr:hypothetical protein [Spirulina sp. 06S082]MEA5467270.1 hypothetical protein [Spirulina sp. 06S082]
MRLLTSVRSQAFCECDLTRYTSIKNNAIDAIASPHQNSRNRSAIALNSQAEKW